VIQPQRRGLSPRPYQPLLPEDPGSEGRRGQDHAGIYRRTAALAQWLIKGMEQRNKTIYKVAESIVKFQTEFLEHGISLLKPMVLKDVAEDISMHESTISRVTTNKYMHTPQASSPSSSSSPPDSLRPGPAPRSLH